MLWFFLCCCCLFFYHNRSATVAMPGKAPAMMMEIWEWGGQDGRHQPQKSSAHATDILTSLVKSSIFTLKHIKLVTQVITKFFHKVNAAYRRELKGLETDKGFCPWGQHTEIAAMYSQGFCSHSHSILLSWLK